MAIGIPDILFYWDAARGVASPTIGGPPVFSRAGNAFGKMIEALNVEILGDTPRFEPDGLRLERAQMNKLAAGNVFDIDGSNWAGWSGSITTAQSMFDGKTAKKFTGTNTARHINNVIGTYTTTKEASTWMIEGVKVGVNNTTELNMHNNSSANWMFTGSFNWTTEVYTISLFTDSDFSPIVSVVKVADVGPNGGPVFIIEVIYDPNAASNGDIRSMRINPVESSTSDIVVMHVAQVVEDGFSTSFVDGTRPTDTFHWIGNPDPQAMVVYCKFRHLTDAASIARLWSFEAAGSIRWFSFFSAIPNIQIFLQNSTTSASATVGIAPSPGDIVEFVSILNADGSQRLIVRKNGGAVLIDSVGAISGGLPAAWDDNVIALNSTSTGSAKGNEKFQKLKIVKQGNIVSALDGSGTGDEDIMAEMAGLIVSADASRVSNTV